MFSIVIVWIGIEHLYVVLVVYCRLLQVVGFYTAQGLELISLLNPEATVKPLDRQMNTSLKPIGIALWLGVSSELWFCSKKSPSLRDSTSLDNNKSIDANLPWRSPSSMSWYRQRNRERLCLRVSMLVGHQKIGTATCLGDGWDSDGICSIVQYGPVDTRYGRVSWDVSGRNEACVGRLRVRIIKSMEWLVSRLNEYGYIWISPCVCEFPSLELE